jgi:proteic killer suppression protein
MEASATPPLFVNRQATRDTLQRGEVIRSFKHRGLQALYYGRTARRVAPEHVAKLRDILAVLDRSRMAKDMDLPGFRLHALKGVLKGHCAVSVSGNWRVTFRFEDGHATDVDYTDYH